MAEMASIIARALRDDRGLIISGESEQTFQKYDRAVPSASSFITACIYLRGGKATASATAMALYSCIAHFISSFRASV